jgi:integrase
MAVRRNKQRQHAKWLVDYYDAMGKRRSKSFSSRKAAEEFDKKKRDEKERTRSGLAVPRDSTLLLDYAIRWGKKRERSHGLDSAETDMGRLRNHWLPEFGLRPLDSITPTEIKDHLDQIEEKFSVALRNRCRAVLHKLYQDAFEDEIIDVNPVARAKLKTKEEKKHKRQPKVLQSKEQIEAYLLAAQEEDETFFVYCAIRFYTGVRPGEAIAILNCDILWRERVILVRRTWSDIQKKIVERTKGRSESGRVVPLSPALYEILSIHYGRSRRKLPDAPFLQRGDGGPLSRFTLNGIHKRVIEKTGLPDITLHQMRHSFATVFKSMGGTKDELQTILGHSSTLVTDIYIDLPYQAISAMGERIQLAVTHSKQGEQGKSAKKTSKLIANKKNEKRDFKNEN